jgi:nickel/cobalt transporter (NicO) family protein
MAVPGLVSYSAAMLSMPEHLPPLALGFAAGLRHALDADHLVAMATIVSRERSLARSMLFGGFWGLGHTCSLLAAGLAMILIGSPVPDSWSRWLEITVAVMLVALGVLAIVRRKPQAAGFRPPGHARPFTVGVVHGLAGSGAMALVVFASARSPWVGLAAVGLFGLGSIGGMMAVSGILAMPLARLRRGRMESWARVLVGATSIAFGIYYGIDAA